MNRLSSWLRSLPEIGRRHRPYSVYIGDNRLLVGTRWGTKMVLPANDRSLAPELALTGEYDRWLAAFLRRHLPAGGTFVDVGAHVGTFTLLGARLLTEQGRVVAFEANPDVQPWLDENVERSYLQNIVVCKAAAWDEEGDVPFRRDALFTGSSGVPDLYSDGMTSVKATTLDRVCKGMRIDVLKVDVEGGELHVLRGAEDLIARRCVRFIVFEAIRRHAGSRWQSLSQWVEEAIREGAQLQRPVGSRGRTTAASLSDLEGGTNFVLAFSR